MADSVKVDTSGLRKTIPGLVASGRRTMAEQCVTSMGMILQDAQRNTPFVDMATMDAELDVTLSPAVLDDGTLSTNKRRQREVVNFNNHSPNAKDWSAFNKLSKADKRGAVGPSTINAAMAIVVARTLSGSTFNKKTGGRWKLDIPDFGHRSDKIGLFWAWVKQKAEEMVKSRHSSAHFLQAGYITARDACVKSPLFKNRFRARVDTATKNNVNKLSPMPLGAFRMTPADSSVVSVTGENNVGDRFGQGNPVLDAEHREALMTHALPNVEASVAKETMACEDELRKRMVAELDKFNKTL